MSIVSWLDKLYIAPLNTSLNGLVSNQLAICCDVVFANLDFELGITYLGLPSILLMQNHTSCINLTCLSKNFILHCQFGSAFFLPVECFLYNPTGKEKANSRWLSSR